MNAADLATQSEPGTGTPIVFLHGWLGSKESWRQVRRDLDIDNPLLFYDHRCHGESPCAEFDFDDLADDLHTLIAQHGFEDPVLVGHSMGGMVALTYAVRYDTLGGLVLLGTCASTPEPEVKRPQFYLDNFHEMEREEWAEMIAENYLGQGAGPLWEETVQELVAADDEPVISGLEAMVEYDVRDELDSVDVPAMVVGGRQDGAITPEKSRELADLLDCRLEMIDSSHLMLQEVPGTVTTLLASYLEEHGQ